MQLLTCSIRWSAITPMFYPSMAPIKSGGNTNKPCINCGSHQLWRLRFVFKDDLSKQEVKNLCVECIPLVFNPGSLGLRYAGKINKRASMKTHNRNLICSICGSDSKEGFWVGKFHKEVTYMYCKKCMLKSIYPDSYNITHISPTT